MDFWAEHWLSVGVGVFWLSMILYGHYRGLVRIAVTMSALILSLVVTRVAMPCVTAVLNENTAVHQAIGQGLLHMAGVKDENEAAEKGCDSAISCLKNRAYGETGNVRLNR